MKHQYNCNFFTMSRYTDSEILYRSAVGIPVMLIAEDGCGQLLRRYAEYGLASLVICPVCPVTEGTEPKMCPGVAKLEPSLAGPHFRPFIDLQLLQFFPRVAVVSRHRIGRLSTVENAPRHPPVTGQQRAHTSASVRTMSSYRGMDASL